MAYAALGLIWRRSGYGRVSNLVCGRGGGWVCRSFSSVRSGRMLPWLMLARGREGGEMVHKFFSLAENRVLSFNCSYLDPDDNYGNVGSSNGWVCQMNYDNRDMDLINPLTRRHVKLPSLKPFGEYVSPSKIILSCSPSEEEEEEGQCRALIAYDKDDELAFCCPGPSGTPIAASAWDHESFAYSRRQKLFILASFMVLQAWDLRDPLSPKLMTLTEFDPRALLRSDVDMKEVPWPENFLVVNEDTDDLFRVTRFVLNDEGGHDFDLKTTIFDVHRYDPESGTVRYMERGGGSLDGLSFFIGTNMNGFALSAKEFPELKPNSIYFVLEDYCRQNIINVGIFSYEDATVSPLCGVVPRFNKTISTLPRWFTPNTSSN